MKNKKLIGCMTGLLAVSVAMSVYAEEAVTEDMTVEAEAVSEVVLGDYSGLVYSWTAEEVTDDEVEAQIEEILASYTPDIEYVESGTVEVGDAIKMSASGAIDGEEDENLTLDEIETVIGSGELLEEFENALIGLEAGVESEVSFVFPDDYEWSEDMQGKTAQMTVTIHGIGEEQSAPELTDEWVVENIGVDTVDEYKAMIRSELEEMAEDSANYTAATQLVNQLVEASTVTYNDDVLDTMADEEIEALKEDAEAEEMSYEDYLAEYIGVDEASYREETIEYIKETVKSAAVVRAYAEEAGVDISDEAFETYLEEMAALYGYEDGEAYLEDLAMWGIDEDYIRESFEEEKVGLALMEIAEEVPAEDMTESDEDWENWEEWEYDTEDWEDWEFETDDWEEWEDWEWESDDEDGEIYIEEEE